MKQILVIDDDIAFRELVTEYLEPNGYTIEAVYDGAVMKGVLRRMQIDPDRNQNCETLAVGDIEIDSRTRTVRRAGEVVKLTLIEYLLLEKLINAPGRIVERVEIAKEILRRNLSPLDRSIDTHLSNLRRKVGRKVNGVERIKTVRGVGYIYASPEIRKA
jgi:DNA-binding response OmpR family regulator